MSGRQAMRIDRCSGRRQGFARHVVVGDDDRCPLLPCTCQRSVGGNTGVTRKDQAGAIRYEAFEARHMHAMALLAGGNMECHLGRERLQSIQQHGRSGLAISVKVSPYDNPLSISNGLVQKFDSFCQVWQVCRLCR
jgi:hypothetical protein